MTPPDTAAGAARQTSVLPATPEETVAAALTASNLLADYAHCIDTDDLERWPEYFTQDCRYHVTTAFNHDRNLPAGLIHARGRAMLEDRVASLRGANVYEPQRYRHIVSAVRITGVADGVIEAEANFLVVRIMVDGQQDVFVCGRYLDRIDTTGPAPRYAGKTVVLDSEKVDTLLAIPL